MISSLRQWSEESLDTVAQQIQQGNDIVLSEVHRSKPTLFGFEPGI